MLTINVINKGRHINLIRQNAHMNQNILSLIYLGKKFVSAENIFKM